jgi:2'-5' RNA ligase
MRLFVAVELEGNLRDKAAEIENKIKECGCDVKLVEPENLHFTVKFLGEVREEHVKDIESKISGALENIKGFKLGLEGVGYFGSPKHISVLWIGLHEGREEFVKLTEEIGRSLSHIRREERKPSPHLTIGRVKSGTGREKLLEAISSMKHVKLGEMDVKFVKLKRSMLAPEGPAYSDVKTFELG